MKLETQNAKTPGIFFTKQAKLKMYLNYLSEVAKKNTYDYAESSINCPFDQKINKKIDEIYKSKALKKLKYLFIVGIGGSNLGFKAFYDALYGSFDLLTPNRFPKVIFLDTINIDFLKKIDILLKDIKSPEEFLINIITKSGGTTETIANYNYVYNAFGKKFKKLNERTIITTDYQSSIWHIAEKEKITTLSVPQKVGGRFSIFSAVGLFPLKAIGLNIQKIMQSAASMRNECLKDKLEENPAVISALSIFYNFKKGININDNFFFNPELESLGKWYRQLMGESLGKQKNIHSKTVDTGITPTVSIGSTDLHSLGQLYLGGPKDKFTTFVIAQTKNLKIPITPFTELTPSIKNKTANQIMEAILTGTTIAYQKRGLPFLKIYLNSINEETIAKFMQFKMMEIMFLGNLMEINAFDQPNVENYKKETKKILSS